MLNTDNIHTTNAAQLIGGMIIMFSSEEVSLLGAMMGDMEVNNTEM